MPVVRTGTAKVGSATRAALLRRLKAELARDYVPGRLRQPLIWEEKVVGTNTMHVAVFWDDWSKWPPAERSKLIVDAYTELDEKKARGITLAMGLTFDEAFDLNMLPYEVVASHRRGDPVSLDRLQKALLDAGAIKTSHGVRLGFPTQAMARDALRELSERVRGPYWGIQQSVAMEED